MLSLLIQVVSLCNIFIDAVSHVIQQDLVTYLCNIVLVIIIINVILQTQPHPLRMTLFGQVIHHIVEVLCVASIPYNAHLFNS